MNREDIIHMAHEAAPDLTWYAAINDPSAASLEELRFLTRFAALVAAAEREAMVKLAAEQGWAMKNEDPFEDAVREIAAIRARSST